MTLPHGGGLGARYLGEGRCRFRVWAPNAKAVEVHLLAPVDRTVRLRARPRGYHEAVVEDVPPDARYVYRLDGATERADPASDYQPQGVHGPSQVTDHAFPWEDRGWSGAPLNAYVIYELHVGTFTPDGTFDAVIPHLDHLRDLGVTAVEVMPVAQFPGSRNWGYDGVFPFAAQDTYGGPAGLKRLVNACHKRGLALVLDVVYNHLGPEGNYLSDFGPYFTDRYRTPWGRALNFDGPHSDEVRRYFVENALRWTTDYHVDALRLDAVHAIVDHSAVTFLEDIARAVHERREALGRRVYAIAESDLNNPRLVRSAEAGGYGLDAQWSDDFHHAVHAALTGERDGYYQDFGSVKDVARAYTEGYVYRGQRSLFRRRRHGSAPHGLPGEKFVVCVQNHDQVGNRMLGERLTALLPFEALKLAAGALLLSPYTPLLFMGEEYGEVAPFQYFVSHTDPGLIVAVRRGRAEEFRSFARRGEVPDPQSEETFQRSKLDHALCSRGRHKTLLEWYRTLLALRRASPALGSHALDRVEASVVERALVVRRWADGDEAVIVLHFSAAPAQVTLPFPHGLWRRALDSTETRWAGSGATAPEAISSGGGVTLDVAPYACALFRRVEEQE